MFSGFSQQRGMILIFEHSIFFGHKLFTVAGKRLGVVGYENCVFRMHSLRTSDDGSVATKGRGATSTGFSNHFNDVLKSVRVFTWIDLYWRNATLNEMLHKFITWRGFKSAALLSQNMKNWFLLTFSLAILSSKYFPSLGRCLLKFHFSSPPIRSRILCSFSLWSHTRTEPENCHLFNHTSDSLRRTENQFTWLHTRQLLSHTSNIANFSIFFPHEHLSFWYHARDWWKRDLFSFSVYLNLIEKLRCNTNWMNHGLTHNALTKRNISLAQRFCEKFLQDCRPKIH